MFHFEKNNLLIRFFRIREFWKSDQNNKQNHKKVWLLFSVVLNRLCFLYPPFSKLQENNNGEGLLKEKTFEITKGPQNKQNDSLKYVKCL